MKLWPFLIGIILICALVSSPVLAMSKSDLIASYHDESRKVFKPPIFPEEYGTIKDLRNWSIKPTPVPNLDTMVLERRFLIPQTLIPPEHLTDSGAIEMAFLG
jgi:hypothetical protein